MSFLEIAIGLVLGAQASGYTAAGTLEASLRTEAAGSAGAGRSPAWRCPPRRRGFLSAFADLHEVPRRARPVLRHWVPT